MLLFPLQYYYYYRFSLFISLSIRTPSFPLLFSSPFQSWRRKIIGMYQEMYAETGFMLPYFQFQSSFSQQFDDFSCSSQRTNALLLDNLTQGSSLTDYDLGVEGDLFKAPAPIMEEPLIGMDPVTAAISMISCGGDVISSQDLKVTDIDSSIDDGQLLSEVFYECKNDILAKEATEATLSEILDMKAASQESLNPGGDSFLQGGSVQKSLSSGCLSSMEWIHGPPKGPNFLDFPGFDLGYGMRRAFSEGDIKALANGSVNVITSPHGQPPSISTCTYEDRKEKLSRYRNKKSKRNFGRKIKYACRKALADSQPRIRGRFAKTEEMDSSKK